MLFCQIAIEDPAAVTPSSVEVYVGVNADRAVGEPARYVVVALVDPIEKLLLLPDGGGFGVPDFEKNVVTILDGMVVFVGRGDLQALEGGVRTAAGVDEDGVGKIVVDLHEAGECVGKAG